MDSYSQTDLPESLFAKRLPANFIVIIPLILAGIEKHLEEKYIKWSKNGVIRTKNDIKTPHRLYIFNKNQKKYSELLKSLSRNCLYLTVNSSFRNLGIITDEHLCQY